MTDRGSLDSNTGPDTSRAGSARLVQLSPTDLLLVAVGGACGTSMREGLSILVPDLLPTLPLAVLLINITGAFMLGVLLNALAVRGPDRDHRRSLRLLLGTGFMGGYTTYSSLTTGAARLLSDGHGIDSVLYALATVLVGALATWAGIAVAAVSLRGRRTAGAA